MTFYEYHTLSNSKLYKFTFYYGRVVYGILGQAEPSGKAFLVSRDKLHKLVSENLHANEIGEEINIGTIRLWEAAEEEIRHSNTQGLTIFGNPLPKATKLVIIGAGASYGLFSDDNNNLQRPPLAGELFDDRFDQCLRIYPGAKNMAAEILQSNDIEEFFQSKWNQIIRNHDKLLLAKLINIQYYLHDLFLHISKDYSRIKRNNYNALISLAHDYTVNSGEHILFVNFNYDTLLEEAMRNTVQYDFGKVEDYVDFEKRKLLMFKPHGSCNLVKKFDKGILSNLSDKWNVNSITILSRLLFEAQISYDVINKNLKDEWELLQNDEIIWATDKDHMDEILYLPQLLIPFKSKDEFVMPERHNDVLNYFLDNINEILVIGWKGTEENFQNLLKHKLANRQISITAVTKGDDIIKNEFAKSLPSANCNLRSQTFSDYMKYCVSKKSLF